jgi:hypothetical protein
MAGRPAVGAAGARPGESTMERTTRRKWFGGGATLGGVVGAACGAPAGQPAPSTGAAAKKPVTLRLNYRTEK